MDVDLQEVVAYIHGALEQGQSRDAITVTLREHAWTDEDIKAAFSLVDGRPAPDAYNKDAVVTHSRRGLYAKLSLALSFVAAGSLFVFPLLALPLIVAAFVLGILGVHTRHSVMASFGIFFSILSALFIALSIYSVYHVLTTHTAPFTNEPLTADDLSTYGLSEEDL